MMNREELEAEKLRFELRDMNRPWPVRNFQGIVALSVAFATIGLGFYTGLFDAERATLELQKEKLHKDISEFTSVKDSLLKTNDGIVQVNDSLQVLATTYRREVERQKQLALARSIEVARLQASLRPVAERASYYEKAVRDAQGKYAETKSRYIGELFTKFDSEHDLRQALSKKEEVIQVLKEDTSRLRESIKDLLGYQFIGKGASRELNKYYDEVLDDYINRRNQYHRDNQRLDFRRDSLHRLIDSITFRMHLDDIE